VVPLLRSSALARASAALLATALSGAPRVVASLAPAAAHACRCHSHRGAPEGECDCALCRRVALSAQAADENLPPCHRAAARTQLAGGERDGGSRSSPCLERTCGSSGAPALEAGQLDPGVVADVDVVASVPPYGSTASPADGTLERALEPETPPPKPA
jgi:hypothetical protein